MADFTGQPKAVLPLPLPISSLGLVRIGTTVIDYMCYFLHFQGDESVNTVNQRFFWGYSASFNPLVTNIDFNEGAWIDMGNKHLLLSLQLHENTGLITPCYKHAITSITPQLFFTHSLSYLRWQENKFDRKASLAKWEADASQANVIKQPQLHLRYSKSSGSRAPSINSDQVKICSSRAAYKNMLHIPQRLITTFQSW